MVTGMEMRDDFFPKNDPSTEDLLKMFGAASPVEFTDLEKFAGYLSDVSYLMEDTDFELELQTLVVSARTLGQIVCDIEVAKEQEGRKGFVVWKDSMIMPKGFRLKETGNIFIMN